jgi:hypothetical protein
VSLNKEEWIVRLGPEEDETFWRGRKVNSGRSGIGKPSKAKHYFSKKAAEYDIRQVYGKVIAKQTLPIRLSEALGITPTPAPQPEPVKKPSTKAAKPRRSQTPLPASTPDDDQVIEQMKQDLWQAQRAVAAHRSSGVPGAYTEALVRYLYLGPADWKHKFQD